VSWHLSKSQRRTSYMPPVSLWQIVSRHRLGKHVHAATKTCKIEELSDALFSVRSISYQRRTCVSHIVARQRLGTRSSGKEELLQASFSERSVSYDRKVGDKFFLEIIVISSLCIMLTLHSMIRGSCCSSRVDTLQRSHQLPRWKIRSRQFLSFSSGPRYKLHFTQYVRAKCTSG
jgi:hypothetical protein